MAEELSARHQLPYLAVGQAQKEITHNEALVRLDALLHPVIEAELSAPPQIEHGAEAGKCWLIGVSPSNEWQGKTGEVAYWTGNGWRYLSIGVGATVFNRTLGLNIIRQADGWHIPPSIAAPNGGSIVDSESRAAINAILEQMRISGLIAAS